MYRTPIFCVQSLRLKSFWSLPTCAGRCCGPKCRRLRIISVTISVSIIRIIIYQCCFIITISSSSSSRRRGVCFVCFISMCVCYISIEIESLRHLVCCYVSVDIMCIYIYIYIHTCIYTWLCVYIYIYKLCVYIYIERERDRRERERKRCGFVFRLWIVIGLNKNEQDDTQHNKQKR